MVTGIPGSGKTTLVEAPSTVLGVPVISKDTIKEALGEVLSAGGDEQSRLLGAASYEILFAIASRVPGRVILESNFGPPSTAQL